MRLGNLLKISDLPTTDPIDFVENEHKRRVWWTAICMDLMTCTELSLAPAYRFEEIPLTLPDDRQLVIGADEFNDALYLTAQVNLCRLKHRIIETALQFRAGNASDAYTLIRPCFELLRAWKNDFSPILEFTENVEFTHATLALPAMRTVASMMMRSNQVIILLLQTHQRLRF